MTTSKGQVTVIARPELAAAVAADGRSRSAIARAVEAAHGTPARAHTLRVFTKDGYGIARDKAERIAEALGRPVGELFTHKDGTCLT
jgi:hypothetical protein